MIAVGLGLHNLDQGLAIGPAYTVGNSRWARPWSRAFALHNTTDGLAGVVPFARQRLALPVLTGLGLIASVRRAPSRAPSSACR